VAQGYDGRPVNVGINPSLRQTGFAINLALVSHVGRVSGFSKNRCWWA